MSEQGADLVGRHKKLVHRTLLVSVLTLVSRILGYVREMLAAWLFGDRSGIFDAFITAWRVPNLFRRLLGEGAISTSFQTALTEADGSHGEAAGRRLFADTAKLLLGILLALTAVAMGTVALMPDAMPGTGWAWLGSDPAAVRELALRVMPFLVLICFSAFVGGALNVRGHFAAPAIAPAVLNVCWIATLGLIAARYGFGVGAEDAATHLEMARLLAWGVLLAGVAQLAVQLGPLARTGFVGGGSPPPRAPGAPGAGLVIRRALPLALGAAVYQINVMVDGLMAESLLPDGGPTLHYFANRVQQFPLALVAIAATSSVFPALQAHGHAGDRGALRRLHDQTHRGIAFLAVPASIGLFVLARPIIELSFERGAFGAEGVARTTAALRMLTLAILPAGATGLVARTYYALGDFRTPVRISILMLLVNVALNLALIRVAGMDVDGLALATALSSWLTLALLLPGLRGKLDLPASEGGWARFALELGIAGAATGLAAWGVYALLGGTPLLALLAAMATGGLAFAVTSVSTGNPEARLTLEKLRRRSG